MLLVANLLKYSSYICNTSVHNYYIMLSRALAISLASENFYHGIANAILVLRIGR